MSPVSDRLYGRDKSRCIICHIQKMVLRATREDLSTQKIEAIYHVRIQHQNYHCGYDKCKVIHKWNLDIFRPCHSQRLHFSTEPNILLIVISRKGFGHDIVYMVVVITFEMISIFLCIILKRCKHFVIKFCMRQVDIHIVLIMWLDILEWGDCPWGHRVTHPYGLQ